MSWLNFWSAWQRLEVKTSCPDCKFGLLDKGFKRKLVSWLLFWSTWYRHEVENSCPDCKDDSRPTQAFNTVPHIQTGWERDLPIHLDYSEEWLRKLTDLGNHLSFSRSHGFCEGLNSDPTRCIVNIRKYLYCRIILMPVFELSIGSTSLEISYRNLKLHSAIGGSMRFIMQFDYLHPEIVAFSESSYDCNVSSPRYSFTALPATALHIRIACLAHRGWCFLWT